MPVGPALMCSLRIADGLNTMTRRGEIGTSDPVLGLRPIRCPFLRTTKEPNDESFTVSPRSRQSVISLRFIYVEAGDDKAVLACFEEALRHRKLRAVVAEVTRLPMTASRRLQLAAEGSGVIGLALRRWRGKVEAAEFRQLTASTTRWRVSALPSTPLPVPGVGRARWRLELLRCRAGESADFEVEACDAQGRLALPSNLAHGLWPSASASMPAGHKAALKGEALSLC